MNKNLEIIKKTKPEIINDVEIIIISNVWEAIHHCLIHQTILILIIILDSFF